MNLPLPADCCRVDAYIVEELTATADVETYTQLLATAYRQLGFMDERVLPSAGSRRFVVRYGRQVVAIFRLTEVSDKATPYHRWLPPRLNGKGSRWLEVNNVVVAAEFRATILLGLILYRSVCIAQEGGFDAVVGITRQRTLRFFVEFGAVPVAHPPLHLLGRPDLHDFVIYYDTCTPASVAYMHQRAARWFHQQEALRRIQVASVARKESPVCDEVVR